MTNEVSKMCNDCQTLKNINDFYNSNTTKDNKQVRCKPCSNIRNNKRKEKLRSEEEKNGVFRRRIKKFTKQKEVIEDYLTKKFSLRDLERKYEICHSQIKNILTKQNIPIDKLNCKRKHEIYNENYFEVIDTEDKAYFLGLLWTDGCNYRNNEKYKVGHRVLISLQEGDKHILEELCLKIYKTTSIMYLKNRKGEKDGINRQNQWCITIPNKKLSDDLFNLGMVPNKSLILEWPKNLPDNLVRHFLRGVMDGDGSISSGRKYIQYETSIVSASEKFMNSIISHVNNNLQLNLNIKIKKNHRFSRNPIYKFSINGNIKTKKLLDWLYQDSSVKLNRKYQRYLDLCALAESP